MIDGKLDGRIDSLVMNEDFFEKMTAQMEKREPGATMIGNIMGISIFQSDLMPDNMAFCLDASGKIIGVIDGREKDDG